MNKTCARCSKVVYNIEELKCLDKTWHKTCFRCHECDMTLNMKTYKGFNKLPYCEAHIPKAKATAIADTPELKRIAENTKIQSNVKYHAEFEKQKGKLTQVADDPETLRIKANTKIISNVAYHGDLEKKAAMEKQRGTAEVVETRDNESEYFSETLAAEQLTQYQQSQQQQHHHHHHQPPTTTQTHIHQAIMQNTQPSIASQQPQIIAQNNSQSYSGMAHQQQQQLQQQQQMQSYPKQPPPQQQQHQQSQLQQQSQQQMKHSPPTSQNYQQNMSNQSNYPSQNYQQMPQNNYMHIRSSIVQNAHLPSGGQVAQDMSKYYDQYENYARPTSNAQIPQNSYNNNNNPSVYNSQQQHQQQQPQQQNLAYQQQQQQMQGNGGQTQAGVGYNSQYNQMNYNSSNVPGMNSVTTVIGNGSSNGSVLGGVGVIGGSSGIGKIADYDPLTDGPRNMPSTTRQSATLIYSSDRGAVTSSNNPRRVGSIADIDPANGIYGSITEQNNAQNQYYQQQNQVRQGHQHHHHHQQQQQQQQQQVSQQQQQVSQQQQQQNHQTKTNLVTPVNRARLFRALYDYEAQDTDEVSFSEGDLIFEVESIDSGWMTGKVERTGKTGMLPANYVQPAVI